MTFSLIQFFLNWSNQTPLDFLIIKDNKKIFLKDILPKKFIKNIKKDLFFIDGGIYIYNSNFFLKNKKKSLSDAELFIVNKFYSIDVDTYFDLELARSIYDYSLKNRKIKKI